MPKYYVEYRYTQAHYDHVLVEADDAEEAADIGREMAELPWDWDDFEITEVEEV